MGVAGERMTTIVQAETVDENWMIVQADVRLKETTVLDVEINRTSALIDENLMIVPIDVRRKKDLDGEKRMIGLGAEIVISSSTMTVRRVKEEICKATIDGTMKASEYQDEMRDSKMIEVVVALPDKRWRSHAGLQVEVIRFSLVHNEQGARAGIARRSDTTARARV